MVKVEVQRGQIEFNHVQPPDHPAVPKLPSSFLAVAGSGQGKTTAILAALLDKNLYRGCFSLSTSSVAAYSKTADY